MELQELYSLLDKYSDRIPINVLKAYLNKLEVTPEEMKPFTEFSDESYQRNLAHEGPYYQALILCWKPEQRSRIHNHAGSSCGLKILTGVATETLFSFSPNGRLVYPVESVWLYQGDVTGSEDCDIHQISNLHESNDLITLHIYSPPLLYMDCYSLESPVVERAHDPINGLRK